MSWRTDPNFVDTPARRLFGGAIAHLRAAEAIFVLAGPEPWAACFVNLDFAIELSLKGFIRHHGGSEVDQKALGHRLLASFDEAVARGYQPHRPEIRRTVEILSPSHEDYSIRYLTGDGPDLVTLPQAIKVVEALIVDLCNQCGLGPGVDIDFVLQQPIGESFRRDAQSARKRG